MRFLPVLNTVLRRIKSPQSIDDYCGKFVEFKSSLAIPFHGYRSPQFPEERYAFIMKNNDKNSYEMSVLKNPDEPESTVLIPASQLITADLSLRLIDDYEVRDIKKWIDAKKAKFDASDKFDTYINANLCMSIRRINRYEHFQRHSNIFNGSSDTISRYFYVERPTLSDEIDRRFDNDELTYLALVGISGSGKSALAKKYMEVSEEKYLFRAWINATDEKTLCSDYLKLADNQDVEYPKDITLEKQALYVKKWLETLTGCLFIYDNLSDSNLIEKYIPIYKNHILLTSSDPVIVSNSLTVDVMQLQEAVVLMQRIAQREISSRRDFTSSEESEFKAVANMLGRLPRALTQAALMMDIGFLSRKEYLSMYQNEDSRKALLSFLPCDNFYRNKAHLFSIWNTFDKDIKRVKEEDSRAFQLLKQLSWLSSEWLPREAMHELVKNNDESIDILKIYDITSVLTHYSLIQFSADFKQIRIHLLLQEVVRKKFHNQDEATVLKTTYDILNTYQRKCVASNKQGDVAALKPHFESIAYHDERLNVKRHYVLGIDGALPPPVNEDNKLSSSNELEIKDKRVIENQYSYRNFHSIFKQKAFDSVVENPEEKFVNVSQHERR